MDVSTRRLMNVKQVAETLSVSESYAYRIITQLNGELEAEGFLTIRGKVDPLYLFKRFFPNVEQVG